MSPVKKNSLRDNFPDGFTMEGKTMAEVNNRSPNVQSFRQLLNQILCGWKTLILNNSQKLVQILLKFSQHIVEAYDFMLAT